MNQFNNLPTPASILQNTTFKPASQIPPEPLPQVVLKIDEASDLLDKLWEKGKHEYSDAYKVGRRYIGVELDADYTEMVNAIISLLFTSIKEQIRKNTASMEEQQMKMTHLTSILKAVKANLDMLKDFDFPIDRTTILALISGFILTQTERTVATFRR